jgi:hypothetical protein
MFERRRHPGLFFFHGSIAWPMRSPVNASPIPSRASAHDSGSMWIATPSPWWTLTTDFLPVSRRTRTKEWNLPKQYPKRSRDRQSSPSPTSVAVFGIYPGRHPRDNGGQDMNRQAVGRWTTFGNLGRMKLMRLRVASGPPPRRSRQKPTDLGLWARIPFLDVSAGFAFKNIGRGSARWDWLH